MLQYLIQIWNSKDLRNKILLTLLILALYRMAAQISIPGANLEAIKAIFSKSQIFGAFSMLTGGSAENFSIMLMGLSPYINASIIVQLMTVVIPKLENLSKEGEQGYRKINQYTRWLALPLGFLQSYGMIALLNSQSQVPIVENLSNPSIILPIMLTITAGTVLAMWLGELISEYGIGNGISILIFINIITAIPPMIAQNLFQAQANPDKLVPFVITLLITIIMTILVIIFTDAVRRIPITYTGQHTHARAEQSVLPIRVNQAGMIPIIFAVSIVSLPTLLSQLMQNATSEWLRGFAAFLGSAFTMQGIPYLVLYFMLIIGFTYFYVGITFKPDQVAENIQKRGGYIPGIRPGKQTAEYIAKVSSYLNLYGGLFIGFVAVFPLIMQKIFTNMQFGAVQMLLSGAGIIIVAGVVLELVRQINTQLVMHDYKKFY
ncbi:MAG: preprotein translocase subunit SecY, preprotein translocase subunit SecY [Candidatus Peregrinibacteria bacterium GW2011_GWC2_39_14]|nr:MAG: Protein translocase subunit SecY [Candidatus Peregrinibacteria bacterium GW2011_GWA2_38_36]KKR06845.1 MAG: preprotein translocase subunit SecY, preprotein translocase subunit SecY [Candidatus Peregrinibacteria bacterium GW2011_GWC2_39_14]